MEDLCTTKIGPMRRTKWHHILDAATKEEFIARARRLDPEGYVKSGSQIDGYVLKEYGLPAAERFKPDIKDQRPWRRVQEIEDYLDIFVRNTFKGRQMVRKIMFFHLYVVTNPGSHFVFSAIRKPESPNTSQVSRDITK